MTFKKLQFAEKHGHVHQPLIYMKNGNAKGKFSFQKAVGRAQMHKGMNL